MNEMSFNVQNIRREFPILNLRVHGKPLVYFDNAATTQKPQVVLDTLSRYYRERNSNIHRGVHYLSQQATVAHEQARETIRGFVHAAHAHEIIFTRGTTDSINLVASSFSERYLNSGDEVLVTCLEHHSNIVPWQLACGKKGATLKVVPITDDGELIYGELEKLVHEKTKVIALCHVSNALGTINDVKRVIELAHRYGIPVLLDGAQSVAHTRVDVQELDVDFFCFSGHKLYGPTGIGVLYGKEKWLDAMPPYQGGGEMIREVTFEKTTYNELPFKFEAGTPNIAGTVGLEAAVKFLQETGLEQVEAYEQFLLAYATEKIGKVDNILFYGQARKKAAVLSFLLKGIHPFDAGMIIDRFGVAIRTGHHCTQPLMKRLGIAGTMRASFAMYNTKEEIDVLVEAVLKAKSMLE